jgi:heterodisulfide reductase subunit C
MGEMKQQSMKQADPGFKYRVAEKPGGERVKSCFACGTCTASCPVREIDDRYNPRKIIRMVLLGLKDEVLGSDFIWLCSSCYSCFERCPQNVKITDLMTALKNLAVEAGHLPPALRMQAGLLKEHGRLYEIEEFDNKKREKMELPAVKLKHTDIGKIMELCKLAEKMDIKEGSNE